MDTAPYKQLAERLDSLPNGFPPTDDRRELRLLAKIFTPEEALLASQLTSSLETIEQIAARTGREAGELRRTLKAMSRAGLIPRGSLVRIVGSQRGVTKHQPQEEDWRWGRDQKKRYNESKSIAVTIENTPSE